jgi:hypothetical protein
MQMSTHITNYSRFLIVDIEKPMYTHEGADCVRVNLKYIKQATQNCQYLVIRTPYGEKVFFPKELKKAGKKVKEVFLYKDLPMVLYEVLIPRGVKKDEDYYRWT